MQGRGQSAGIPGPQRGGHPLGDLRGCGTGQTGASLNKLVEAPENGRRGQSPMGGEGQDPQIPAAGHQRGELVAAPMADRGGPHEGEGDVGTELGRQIPQLVRTQFSAPQDIAGRQRRRGIRRASGHAPGHGDALADRQIDAIGDAGRIGQEARSAHSEIGGVGGDAGGVLLQTQCDTAMGCVGLAPGGDGLDEPHGLEDRGQRVVAVRAGGAGRQEEVDLPRSLDTNSGCRAIGARGARRRVIGARDGSQVVHRIS